MGTRGNSKYHYYGVRIKASSDLRIPTYDIDNPIISHSKDVKYENNNNNNNNNIKFSPSKPNNTADYLHHSFYPQHELVSSFFFLLICLFLITNIKKTKQPQISIQITDFAITNTGNMHQNVSNSFASLANVYHTFAGQFLHSVYSQSISEIEKLVRFYFLMISSQYKDLFEYPEVTSFILAKDQVIYKSIYHLLFASILRSISSPNIYFITYFVKNYVVWIEGTMGDLPMDFVQQKIAMAKEFSVLLQKMANINHFAHLLKGVFNTPMLIGQMYDDLEKIDVKFILQQIPFIDSPTDSFFLRFFDDFKETLKEKMNIEMIAIKLCDHFDRYADSLINSPASSPSSSNGSPSSHTPTGNGNGNGNGLTLSSSPSSSHSSLANGDHANGSDLNNDRIKLIYNEAVSKFSYYSNSIITDLTIKNAGSFSSFHIFRIFLEEFLSYYILKKSSNQIIRISAVITNNLPTSVVIITANNNNNNNDIHSSSSSLSSSTSSSLSMTSSLTSTSSLGGFDSLNQSKEKQLLHDEYRWSLSTPTLLDSNNSSSNLMGGSPHISGDSHPLYHPSLSSSMDISIEKSTGNLNTTSPNQTSFISSSSTSTRLYHQPLSSSPLSNMNTNAPTPNSMNQPTLPMINSGGGNEGISGGRRMAIVGISNPPYQTLPFIPRPGDPNNNPIMTNNSPFPNNNNNNNNSLLNVINNNNPSPYLPSNTSLEMRDKIALNAVNSNSISSRSNNMNSNMNNNNNNNNHDDQPKNFQQPGWKSAFNWQIPNEYSDRASTAFLDLDDKDSRPLSSAKKKKLDQ